MNLKSVEWVTSAVTRSLCAAKRVARDTSDYSLMMVPEEESERRARKGAICFVCTVLATATILSGQDLSSMRQYRSKWISFSYPSDFTPVPASEPNSIGFGNGNVQLSVLLRQGTMSEAKTSMVVDLPGFSNDALSSTTYQAGSAVWEVLRLTGYRAISPRTREWVNWSCCIMNVFLARTHVGVYVVTFLQKKGDEAALEPVRSRVLTSMRLAGTAETPRDVPVPITGSHNLVGTWSDKGGYASTWKLSADGHAAISFGGSSITGRWTASDSMLELRTGGGTKRYEYRIREVNGNRQLGVRTSGAGEFDWMSYSGR